MGGWWKPHLPHFLPLAGGLKQLDFLGQVANNNSSTRLFLDPTLVGQQVFELQKRCYVINDKHVATIQSWLIQQRDLYRFVWFCFKTSWGLIAYDSTNPSSTQGWLCITCDAKKPMSDAWCLHLADNVKMWRLSEIQWLQPPFFLTLHGGKTRDTPHVFRVSHPTVVVWFMGSPGCLLFGAFVAAFPFSAALGGGHPWPIKRRILGWLTTKRHHSIVLKITTIG